MVSKGHFPVSLSDGARSVEGVSLSQWVIMHFGALLQPHSSYLYKGETQLSLTNRATHLCKCNGVADS